EFKVRPQPEGLSEAVDGPVVLPRGEVQPPKTFVKLRVSGLKPDRLGVVRERRLLCPLLAHFHMASGAPEVRFRTGRVKLESRAVCGDGLAELSLLKVGFSLFAVLRDRQGVGGARRRLLLGGLPLVSYRWSGFCPGSGR